ncbi:DUF4190 domain-containing protein [Corallococcus terminator]|uniref:DUF4190 domain-containing protein n=1 Tax=Corallococcus terminator TaxID=2316733 RepID=A0A3A8HYJ7_9BACT|nr:DUF4190 domain-containing protein [Corallococcus terminator]RKG75446.1 hypothetical protein D7V88_33500 [Corallococcus terminator]
MEAAPAAHCPRHPETLAEGTCTRCGTFTCVLCREGLGARGLCPACQDLSRTEKPSGRAVLSLVFATVGFCGFAPGVVGLVLGQQELNAIEAGTAPASGRDPALIARNVGWFHVVMLFLAFLGLYNHL